MVSIGSGSGACSQTGKHASLNGRRLEDMDLWWLDALAVPASLHDTTGRFIHLNAAGERAAGMARAQWTKLHYLDPVPPEGRELVETNFRRAADKGESTDFVTSFVDGHGVLRRIRAQHLPLLDGDEVVAVLILAWDVLGPQVVASDSRVLPELTPRQLEILQLVAGGSSTADIAKQLSLSTETVRNHLRSVFRELKAHTRVEAIAAAQRFGLLASAPWKPRD